MKQLTQLLRVWSGVFELLRRSAPMLSLSVAIVTVLEAIAGIGVLYMIKVLVDRISEEMTMTAGASFSRLFTVLAITGGVLLASIVLQNVATLLRLRQGLSVTDHVDQAIHTTAISLDLKFYESPAYFDLLERARSGGPERPAQIVSNFINMMRAGFTLAAVLVLLGTIEVRLLPFLILPMLLALFIRLYYSRRLFNWTMSRAQLERRASYLDALIISATHAKELRLNRIGSFLRDQYSSIRRDIRTGRLRIEQTKAWSDLAMSVLGTLVFVGAGAWLLGETLAASRPLGDVVLYILLLRRAEMLGKDFIGNASRTVDDHLHLRRLFDFLSLKPDIKSPATRTDVPKEILRGVEMDAVAFRYAGAPRDTIGPVSITLPPGKIVALVGENGSGKTTLVKLLTRLHDPTSGTIRLDGTDIRAYDPDAYRKLFSVIFQDYSTYAATVAENIQYGDVHLEGDRARIADAAARAGASEMIAGLPRGLDTPLTRLFDDGHELSIGQWQRLALARAFYPESRYIILDEPTSAADAKSEFDLFNNFRERLGGRGALLISHRLSTIRQADYVYVLSEGQVCEHGTHEQLMAANGLYADLFSQQAQLYE